MNCSMQIQVTRTDITIGLGSDNNKNKHGSLHHMNGCTNIHSPATFCRALVLT